MSDNSTPALTWRDVFDSKVPGQYIIETARIAKASYYKFMNFNDHVFDVTGEYPVDTGLLVGDVQ